MFRFLLRREVVSKIGWCSAQRSVPKAFWEPGVGPAGGRRDGDADLKVGTTGTES